VITALEQRRRRILIGSGSEKREGSETGSPVETRSQGSRETVQSPNQNTGNTEISSYLFEDHHKFRINVNPWRI